MKILSCREEFSFTYVTAELSESELKIYESCINYVLKNCDEKNLYDIVGCEDKEELMHFYKQVVKALIANVPKKYLPEDLQEVVTHTRFDGH